MLEAELVVHVAQSLGGVEPGERSLRDRFDPGPDAKVDVGSRFHFGLSEQSDRVVADVVHGDQEALVGVARQTVVPRLRKENNTRNSTYVM